MQISSHYLLGDYLLELKLIHVSKRGSRHTLAKFHYPRLSYDEIMQEDVSIANFGRYSHVKIFFLPLIQTILREWHVWHEQNFDVIFKEIRNV